MADAAGHHQPSYGKDRNPSKESNSLLQTVDDSPADDSPAKESTSNNPAGRPPLSSYLEPEDSPEFAFSTQRIEENYPFFGTLNEA